MGNVFDQFDPKPAARGAAPSSSFRSTPNIKTSQALADLANKYTDTEHKRAVGPALRRKTDAEARKAEAEAKAAEAELLRNMPDKDAIRDSLSQTIEGALRAKQLSRSRFAATGFGSDIMTSAGSPKYAVEAALAPAKANIAIAKLDELAKKGIKLTPISNADIELMKNALVGLDTAQDDESFQRSMDTIVKHFGNALSKIDREPTAEGARAALEARRRAKEAEGR